MVSMIPDSFTGETLVQALKEGSLAQPKALLTGMVKQSDKEGYIAFTRSGCDEWVEIPVNMIQKADLLGHRRCEDHNHPLMQINIQEPTSTYLFTLQCSTWPNKLTAGEF